MQATLYDVYPFSEKPFHDFEIMGRLPTQVDMAEFADAAIALVDADSSARSVGPADAEPDEYRSLESSLWLPEGILSVSKLFERDEDGGFEVDIPTGVRVGFDIFEVSGDPASSHIGEVELSISFKQQLAMEFLEFSGRSPRLSDVIEGSGSIVSGRRNLFESLPVVRDFGVSRIDPEVDELLLGIYNLRDDTLPDALDLRSGTMTSQDLGLAELQPKAYELIDELLDSNDLRSIHDDVQARWESVLTTTCSQRTLRSLTGLLLTHL